jgi:hypothetical protein
VEVDKTARTGLKKIAVRAVDITASMRKRKNAKMHIIPSPKAGFTKYKMTPTGTRSKMRSSHSKVARSPSIENTQL